MKKFLFMLSAAILFDSVMPAMAQQKKSTIRKTTASLKTNNAAVKTFVMGNGKLGPLYIGQSVSTLPKSIPELYDNFTYYKGTERVYDMGDDEGEEVLVERVTFKKNGKEIITSSCTDEKITSFYVDNGASFIKTIEGYHIGSNVREFYRKHPKLQWETYFEGEVFASSKGYTYNVNSDDVINKDIPNRVEDFKPSAKIVSIYYGKQD